MAKCKECVYQPMCYKIEHFGRDLETDEACSKFVNVNKLINLPVCIGDFLYTVCVDDEDGDFIAELEIIGVSRDGVWLDDRHWFIYNDEIGKNYFATREEAENALKERDPIGH